MASLIPIPAALIRRLQKDLGLSRRAVYRRIEQFVNTFHLDHRPAALLLASQHGINTTRFATAEDRAALREAMRGVTTGNVPASDAGGPVVREVPHPPPPERARRAAGKRRRRGGATKVWLVHGRNTHAANELRKLLRALGLKPTEWTQAVARTREGSPYVGTVLDQGIGEAAATVVLMTPDDEGRLRAEYRTATDGRHETDLTPQPRLNVVWEGGMAFGRDPTRAVLVQIGGPVRSFSNITGRHVVHLTGSPESRRELATKLTATGCTVDTDGTDWLSHGDFAKAEPRTRRPRRRKKGR